MAETMRRDCHRPGFTLLEMMIAFGIFAAIAAVFLQLLGSSRQRLTVSSRTFSAIHLAGTAGVELQENARVHTMLLERLTASPELTDRAPVTGARSAYFRELKDRSEPWGELDSGEPGGIVAEDRPLFDDLAPFRLRVVPERCAAPDGGSAERHLLESRILIEWEESGMGERSYELPIRLASPVGPKPPSVPFTVERDQLEPLIRELFFPDLPGKDFPAAVAARGADPDLAFRCGKVAVLLDQLQNALGVLTRDGAEAIRKRRQLLTPPGPDLVDVQMGLARGQETGASLIFQVLLECAGEIRQLPGSLDGSRLNGLPASRVALSLQQYQTLSQEMLGWVGKAGQEYLWLLQDGLLGFMTGRERSLAREKALEAIRLRAVLGQTPAATWKNFATQQLALARGRNPVLAAFFRQEEKLPGSPELIARFLPNLAAIEKNWRQDIQPAVQAARERLGTIPGGGG